MTPAEEPPCENICAERAEAEEQLKAGLREGERVPAFYTTELSRVKIIRVSFCLLCLSLTVGLGIGFAIGWAASAFSKLKGTGVSMQAPGASNPEIDPHRHIPAPEYAIQQVSQFSPPSVDVRIQQDISSLVAKDSWSYRCPIAEAPNDVDPMIKIAALLHHSQVIKGLRGYAQLPHILLIDDSLKTVSGLADISIHKVPTNTMLALTQHRGMQDAAFVGDVMLWDKHSDANHGIGIRVIKSHMRELLRQDKPVHVILDWDNTLHSAGGWTSGKINRWRKSNPENPQNRDSNGLDTLNKHLKDFIVDIEDPSVTFGIATHNSFHKGVNRAKDAVFAEDLTAYFFSVLASAFGERKFEVITAGNPERSSGTNNLWSSEEGLQNGSMDFCSSYVSFDAAEPRKITESNSASALTSWCVNGWWKNKAEQLWLEYHPGQDLNELRLEFQALKDKERNSP